MVNSHVISVVMRNARHEPASIPRRHWHKDARDDKQSIRSRIVVEAGALPRKNPSMGTAVHMCQVLLKERRTW